MGFYARIGKPVLDISAAALGLVVTLPITSLVAVALAINNRGTPFFTQRRPGLHGKPFTIWKFKTMTDERGPDGALLPDAARLTKLGAFVRKSSLDELPQLVNVLKGELSLVGPRPLLMEYLPLYSPEQARRHDVRPGITGWAQVNGRNAIGWKEKFELDVWYVDHQSFWLDCRILLKTVQNVLAAKDISAAGQATMEKYKGIEN
jgi:lipopolysaccharide/colanic/teichoic acid biosynthesis glycosyltransferase